MNVMFTEVGYASFDGSNMAPYGMAPAHRLCWTSMNKMTAIRHFVRLQELFLVERCFLVELGNKPKLQAD